MTAGEARKLVLQRDRFRCVADAIDPAAGQCFDRWGHPFDGYSRTGERLEVDRIQPVVGSRLSRHTDPASMVALCPGHHRGTGANHGRVWATAHRPELRRYLGAAA